MEIPNLGLFIKVKTSVPEDDFSGASFDTLANGMSGFFVYKDLVECKGTAFVMRTTVEKDKATKKASSEGVVDDAVIKAKKHTAKKNNGDDESPLKKSKKTEASAEETSSDAKLAAEMDKLMDDLARDVQEVGEIEDEDNEEEDGDEVLVVKETQREDMDPAIKERKNTHRVV